MGAEETSWGRYPQVDQQSVRLGWRGDDFPQVTDATRLLPVGNRRSYGDSCSNDGGVILDATGLDRMIHFDATSGVIRCEAGVLLSDLLEVVVPAGWFLPVVPGTRFVTVGGAVANDIHGKNHHRSGTFGCHVRALELLRSDGERLRASGSENSDWFAATIGGLGLTGLMTWVEFQLKPIASAYIVQRSTCFADLDGFFEQSAAADEHEYSVAWVDCRGSGPRLGRGVFFSGDTATSAPVNADNQRRLSLPFVPPVSLVGRLSVAVLNTLYYQRYAAAPSLQTVHYAPFFFPLDAVDHWNRAYGPKGFLQYQCVVPEADDKAVIAELLAAIAAAGAGSFLAVLKRFGRHRSPGLLSFPRPGVTLALDFPIAGRTTFDLLDRLDEIVCAAGGAVYPAKDARMSAHAFQTYFPNWQALLPFVDPRLSSGFWRRVTGE